MFQVSKLHEVVWRIGSPNSHFDTYKLYFRGEFFTEYILLRLFLVKIGNFLIFPKTALMRYALKAPQLKLYFF